MSLVEAGGTEPNEPNNSPLGDVTELVKHAIDNTGRALRLALLLVAAAAPLALAAWLWIHLGIGR